MGPGFHDVYDQTTTTQIANAAITENKAYLLVHIIYIMIIILIPQTIAEIILFSPKIALMYCMKYFALL